MQNLVGKCNFQKIENVRVAFEVLPDGKPVPIGCQFDNKMDDFRQKARPHD